MQAALRSLGVQDTDQRIRQFLSDQRLHAYQLPEHDFDCICRKCERHQVLGLRRSRRSELAVAKFAGVQNDALSSTREQVACSNRGVGNLERSSHRRRPVSENARRGESKIGRASNLRPGRITLAPKQTTLTNDLVRLRGGDAVPPGPFCGASYDCKSDVKNSEADDMDQESSWDVDEHSQHSNFLHYEAKLMSREVRVPMPRQADSASPSGATPQDDSGLLFGDFYSQNPAALANGWLALRHHRANPAWVGRRDPSPAVHNVVRCLIQPHQLQLPGLVPTLKLHRPSHGG